ncbi:hypothetical protein V3H56_12670 [Pseudomonas sp. MS646]|uniref:hypothetical protein n=1 Tax=Pseudomonas sp. MS646 TaxID=3118751 RepID=UPI000A710E30
MICGLCKKEKGKLIDSHFMPAAAYPHVRGTGETGNGPPVLINLRRKSAIQTDRQVKRPLLCTSCEDLFSKSGERIMGRLWATASGFPLLDLLNSEASISKGERFDMYDGRLLDAAVVSSIFYFAVSIFWRAQVWDWGYECDAYKRALGPHYELEFRRFLLGEGTLDNVLLLVDVNSDADTSAVMTFPTSGRIGADRLHTFSLLGLKFSMYVGRSISAVTRKPFEFHSAQIMFVASDHRKSAAFQKLAGRVQSEIEAKGKLKTSPANKFNHSQRP